MINALNDLRQIDPTSTVLLVMGTPCEKQTRGVTFNQNPTSKIGMHAPPSSVLFLGHEILIALRKLKLPNISSAEMFFSYVPQLITELVDQWGHPTLVHGAKFGGAARDRYYFCHSPPTSILVTEFVNTNNLNDTQLNGWWNAAALSNGNLNT